MAELESIAEELEKDMTSLRYAGKTVTVKYKVRRLSMAELWCRWSTAQRQAVDADNGSSIHTRTRLEHCHRLNGCRRKRTFGR